jgi:hypothetical protein
LQAHPRRSKNPMRAVAPVPCTYLHQARACAPLQKSGRTNLHISQASSSDDPIVRDAVTRLTSLFYRGKLNGAHW